MKSIIVVAIPIAAMGLIARSAIAAPPPLADFGRLPTASDMQLSPAGDKIAYFAMENDAPRFVVRQIGGAVIADADPGAQKLRAVSWLDNDHVLLQLSKFINTRYFATWKAEIGESLIVNTKTRKTLVVFSNHKKILPITFGYFGYSTDASKSWGYFGGNTLVGGGNAFADFDNNRYSVDHSHIDLYKVDLDTGDAQVVAPGSERRDTQWLVDATGAIVAHAEYDEHNAAWRLYGDADDKVLIASANDATGDFGILGLGRTPGSVLVEQPAGDTLDFTRLEYQKRAGDAGVKPFGEEAIRADLRSPETGLLVGGVTNSDNPKTILFDPALQAKFDKAARALRGETVALQSATANLDRMIVLAEGPGDSGTYFLVDIPARKAEALAWAYPTVLQDAVGATRIVAFKASDGLEMQGVLTLPPGREPRGLPLVVLPHGGPEARDYAHFDWWAQAFASRGYAVFQPNFRGSNGFGKAFRDAGYGQWGRRMQTDVSDGVAELSRQGLVDPKRACIVGASYGGYVALAGVTVQKGLYRCAVSVAGVSDLNAFLFWREEKFGQVNVVSRSDHLYLGVTSAGDSSLKALSPARLASRADAPIMLIHGKDDTVVPIVQSRTMLGALKGAGKAGELVELDGEDHWLSKSTTRIQMLTASVAFVERNNPAH